MSALRVCIEASYHSEKVGGIVEKGPMVDLNSSNGNADESRP